MMTIMKNWCSRRVWIAGVVLLCLSAATAWAATAYFDAYVPGVDAAGNLNGESRWLSLKVNINTRKGTFTGSGKSKVTNNFKKDREFENPAINVRAPKGVFVTADLYKVDKNGHCRLDVSGTIVTYSGPN